MTSRGTPGVAERTIWLICFHDAIFDSLGSRFATSCCVSSASTGEHEPRALRQALVLQLADPHAVLARLERHLDEVLLHRELEQRAQLREQLGERRAQLEVRVARQLLRRDLGREARQLAGELRQRRVQRERQRLGRLRELLHQRQVRVDRAELQIARDVLRR